jgi:hypothetical protein
MSDKDSNVTQLPLHAKGPVKRKPGRPKKVVEKPSHDELEYHAEMMRERERFIADDGVVKALREDLTAEGKLKVIQERLAAEASALEFQRNELDKLGKDTSQVSTRRINALKEIANVELELRKLSTELPDFKSEAFQKVFRLWVQMTSEVAQELLTEEQFDLFVNQLSTKMETWEEDAAEHAF